MELTSTSIFATIANLVSEKFMFFCFRLWRKFSWDALDQKQNNPCLKDWTEALSILKVFWGLSSSDEIDSNTKLPIQSYFWHGNSKYREVSQKRDNFQNLLIFYCISHQLIFSCYNFYPVPFDHYPIIDYSWLLSQLQPPPNCTMMSDHHAWNQYSRPVSNGLFSTVLVSSLMKYADAESSHSMDFPKAKSVVTSKAKSVVTCHLARREQKSHDGSEERPGEVHRGDHHRPGGHRCFLWNVCQVAICLFIHPLVSHATSTWRGILNLPFFWFDHFESVLKGTLPLRIQLTLRTESRIQS